MNDIRSSSLPIKQVITVAPKSSTVIRPTILGFFSTLKIACSVEAGETVGVAGGAMKLVGALRGKTPTQSKQTISDIVIRVYTPDRIPFSFSGGYGSWWEITGSGTIEIPIYNNIGDWHVVLDNENSKVTQKVVNLTLEEISWKDGPPIELSFEIPARDIKFVTFPVASMDRIRAKVGVVSSDIDVYLVSQDNVVGNTATVNFAYLKHQRTSGFTEVYECLKNENISIVFDNRGSKMTTKMVNVSISLESKGSESSISQPTVAADIITSPTVLKETIKETVKEVYLVICPHCGHKNEAGNRFCGKCGASV